MPYAKVQVTINDEIIETGDISAIIEPVWWLVQNEDEASYEESMSKFSEPQRYVYALRWYCSEVSNGGHRQFYWNSSGIVWQDACNAFEAIGLKKGASVIHASVDRLGEEPSSQRDIRQSQLDQMEDDFDEVDEYFYKITKSVDINKLIINYIHANREDFYWTGSFTKFVIPNSGQKPFSA